MSINLIRNDPKRFIPHIEYVKGKLKFLKLIYIAQSYYKGKKGGKLTEEMKTLGSLPVLAIDESVVRACRLTNENMRTITDKK